MILLFLCHGQENLVGRGVKGQRIAVFSEGFPQFVSCPDGGISDVEVEIIREEGIELEPGYKALGQEGTVLFDDGEEMGNQARIRKDDHLAEQGSAFRPADVEGTTETCQIGQGDVVCRAGEGIGQTGSVHIEFQLIFATDFADCGEFSPRVEGSVLRRLGDIDHARHDHMVPVPVGEPVFAGLFKLSG